MAKQKLLNRTQNNLDNVLRMKSLLIQRQKTMVQEQEQILSEINKEYEAKMQEIDELRPKFIEHPYEFQESFELAQKEQRDILERMHLTEEAIAELKKNLAEANELEV